MLEKEAKELFELLIGAYPRQSVGSPVYEQLVLHVLMRYDKKIGRDGIMTAVEKYFNIPSIAMIRGCCDECAPVTHINPTTAPKKETPTLLSLLERKK